jgi:predicted MPP superfamily phosphohydrolase
MTDIAVWLAWFGAIAWPALWGLGLWRGLKAGRGPGWMLWSAIAVITLVWALGIRAFLWEPAMLEVRRVEVTSRGWSGPPLRIGVISDTHTDGPHVGVARLESIIARMNAERPDIVVLLGDFVAGHEDASDRSADERRDIGRGLAAFGKLEPPLGVWSVLGNHDWWYDGAAVESGIVSAGVQVMENSRARIPREGGAFWIGGLADYESRRAQPSYISTLSGVPDNEPVIVLSHWPDPFAAAPARVALTLAGHSHCGQVNLPIVGRLVHGSPGSERWPCGLYEDRDGWLYVAGGVGTSILPVRFGQPPEIAVLTLRGF